MQEYSVIIPAFNSARTLARAVASALGQTLRPADVVVVRPRGGKPRTRSLRRMGLIDRWAALTEFAAAVRERREPQCSGRDNLGSLALAAAAVESADRGVPVRIFPTAD